MRRFGIWKDGKQVGEGVEWSSGSAFVTFRMFAEGDDRNLRSVRLIAPVGEYKAPSGFAGFVFHNGQRHEARLLDAHDSAEPCPRRQTIARLERDREALLGQRSKALAFMQKALSSFKADDILDAHAELARRPEASPAQDTSELVREQSRLVLGEGAGRFKFGDSSVIRFGTPVETDATRGAEAPVPERKKSFKEAVADMQASLIGPRRYAGDEARLALDLHRCLVAVLDERFGRAP